MRQLHKTYSSAKPSEPSAEIVIVYQKEPHTGQLAFKNIEQPETFEQRCELAKRMQEEYELPMTVLVDSMEDQSRAMFSDLPSPAFIIDSKGFIREKFPWADAETIGPAVSRLKVDALETKDSKEAGFNFFDPTILLIVFIAVAALLLIQTQRRPSSHPGKVAN